MASRDSTLKATAAALQPKSLDLTQFRQKSARDATVRVRTDEAAGALAYGALDREDGQGNRLQSPLVRLKYAEQRGVALFGAAIKELFTRVGKPQPPHCGEFAYAVAVVALYEWLEDACPTCRSGKPREDRGIAMQCIACHNSGRRKALPKRERWARVSEYLRDAHRSRGQPFEGLPMKRFEQWHPVYEKMLRELKSADRGLASGIDFRFEATERDYVASNDEEDNSDGCA